MHASSGMFQDFWYGRYVVQVPITERRLELGDYYAKHQLLVPSSKEL